MNLETAVYATWTFLLFCLIKESAIYESVYEVVIVLFAAKQVTIQAVVDNLQISCLEYRNEHDPDVSQYTHNRKIELIEVILLLEE